MKTIKLLSFLFIGSILFTACSDDPTPVDDEEAITRLTLTFTNQSNTADTVVLNWNDANSNEIIDAGEQTVEGEFDVNQTYNATLGLFNLDEDFLQEDILSSQAGIDAHFFVYNTSLGLTMNRANDDNERSDGVKLGVKTVWTAGATAGTGTIGVRLFHESPSVTDTDGFGSATGTETDIDISFNVTIQ